MDLVALQAYYAAFTDMADAKAPCFSAACYSGEAEGSKKDCRGVING